MQQKSGGGHGQLIGTVLCNFCAFQPKPNLGTRGLQNLRPEERGRVLSRGRRTQQTCDRYGVGAQGRRRMRVGPWAIDQHTQNRSNNHNRALTHPRPKTLEWREAWARLVRVGGSTPRVHVVVRFPAGGLNGRAVPYNTRKVRHGLGGDSRRPMTAKWRM